MRILNNLIKRPKQDIRLYTPKTYCSVIHDRLKEKEVHRRIVTSQDCSIIFNFFYRILEFSPEMKNLDDKMNFIHESKNNTEKYVRAHRTAHKNFSAEPDDKSLFCRIFLPSEKV